MKHVYHLIMTLFTVLLLLTACAEEQTITDTQTPQSTKPSKFKAAAIEKVKAANTGMPQETASCVVEAMLAGGTYGLGEINQMKLSVDSLSDNASGLLKAYQEAIKTCQ